MMTKKGLPPWLTSVIHSRACSTVAVALEAPCHCTASAPSTEKRDLRWLFVPYQTTERSKPNGRALRLSCTVRSGSRPGKAMFPPRCHFPKCVVV